MFADTRRLQELQTQLTAARKAEDIAMAALDAYAASGGDFAETYKDLLNEVSVAHGVALRVFGEWKETAERLWLRR
jgi:hypothetical protein